MKDQQVIIIKENIKIKSAQLISTVNLEEVLETLEISRALNVETDNCHDSKWVVSLRKTSTLSQTEETS